MKWGEDFHIYIRRKSQESSGQSSTEEGAPEKGSENTACSFKRVLLLLLFTSLELSRSQCLASLFFWCSWEWQKARRNKGKNGGVCMWGVVFSVDELTQLILGK